jgi:ribonuclease Z
VLSALVRREFHVLVPFGDGHPYDLVLDLDNAEFLRVQCKTAWPSRGCLIFNSRSTDHGRGPQSYLGLADIFGVYFPPSRSVYLVPIDAVADFEGRLRLDPPLSNQKRGIRLASDFEINHWTAASLRQLVKDSVLAAIQPQTSRRLAAVNLSVVFLGTGGSVPSARRSTASILIARGGERLLFDCGEGTQRQMQRSLGLTQADEIYLTHFHADHILGLPGLLKTYDLTDREKPLSVYGPRGLRDLFATLDPIVGRLHFDLELVELAPADTVPHERYEIQSFEVAHGARAYGYALVEDERPGRFDIEAAKRLGVPEGPAFAALQRGEGVQGAAGPVRADEVVGSARPGRTVVISGDTSPTPATVAAAADAELLVHDASFAEEDVQRAAETGHSTVGQAAAVGREAHVKMLALVHISSRYHVGKLLEEAQDVYEATVAPKDFDVIEIPFPERGYPELIPNGARDRDGSGTASTEPPRSS